MTPLDILDELTKILEGLLKDIPSMSGRAYTVYRQNLPDSWQFNEDFEDLQDLEDLQEPPAPLKLKERQYPFCLVKLENGAQEEARSFCEIILIFAVRDEGENMEGYRDIANVLERARQYFIENRAVGKARIELPLSWTLEDGDDHPYYSGGMSFDITIPSYVPKMNRLT